jgi:arsenate reductase
MAKLRVLFICVHNSARSRMAEAFLLAECEDFHEVQSAGLEPGTVNPLAAEAMDELGLDIRQKPAQAVSDVLRSGSLFTHVITVCSEAEAGGCPIFPGPAEKLHWPFPDPSRVEGDHEQKLAQVREIRDAIRAQVKEWCQENCR